MDKNPDIIQIKKMVFIMNALDQGWSVKKIGDSYRFRKKHEGKQEIFTENYLEDFLTKNLGGNPF
jgi:hypothetical protein